MKVGGNTSFADYISKNGRGQVTTSTPAKEKYTSKPAEAYRDELKRKAKEDEIRYGPGIVTTDGVTGADAFLSPPGNGASTPGSINGRASPAGSTRDGSDGSGNAQNGGSDFFDTWDKPTNIIAPSPRPIASPVPRLGFGGASPAITPSGSRAASPAVGANNGHISASTSSLGSAGSALTSPTTATPTTTAAPPTTSRAISSSSIRTTSSAVGGASARPAGGAMKLGGGAKSKLGGVKKGGPAINFEEAERKAKEEEERVKRLGYDREQEEKQAAAAAAAARNAASSRSTTPAGGSRGEMVGHKSNSGGADAGGVGFARLGFGQTSGLSGEEAAKAAANAKRAQQRALSGHVAAEENTAARDKFGGQKGISSDQFFGRNNYDPSAKAEAQARLGQFAGASAISSNAYFGRPDEEDQSQYGGGNRGDEGLLGVESLSDLERAAKDTARRLMQTAGIEDMSDVQNALRQGAMSVSGRVKVTQVSIC